MVRNSTNHISGVTVIGPPANRPGPNVPAGRARERGGWIPRANPRKKKLRASDRVIATLRMTFVRFVVDILSTSSTRCILRTLRADDGGSDLTLYRVMMKYISPE